MKRAYSTAMILASVLAGTLGVSGCVGLRTISVPVEAEVTIPRASIVDQLLGPFAVGNFDFQQAFENTKYNPEDVDAVYLDDFRMSVVSPDGQDLSFLGRARMVLDTAGLPPIVIAEAPEFPPGRREVVFRTTSADLQNYLLAERYTLTFQVEDSQRPSVETRVRISADFSVVISPSAVF